MLRPTKKQLYLSLISGAAVLLLFLPVKIPVSANLIARIIPAKEWLLEKTANGSIVSQISDYTKQSTQFIQIVEIDRGDVMSLQFRHNSESMFAETGDTIGEIISFNTKLVKAELDRLIAQTQAQIAVVRSDEKPAIVKQSMENLQLAKLQKEEAFRIYDRNRQLFDQSLLSAQEFELYKNKWEQAQKAEEIAYAQLEIVQTGEKSEQIALTENLLSSLLRENELIENKLNQYYLKTPFDGTVRLFAGKDTLALVQTRERVLAVPLPLTEFENIESDSVQVELEGIGICNALLSFDQNNTINIGGIQFYSGIIRTEKDLKCFPFGRFISVKITLSRKYLRDYIFGFFEKVFSLS